MSTSDIQSNKRYFVRIILVFYFGWSCFAFAQQPEYDLTVGTHFSFDFQAYKGERVEISILPVFFYDNDLIYAEADELGAYLINDDRNEFRLNAYYDGNMYHPVGRLNQLTERKWSVLAGASYMRITSLGGFKAQVGRDVLGRSHGTVASLSYLAEFEFGAWSIYPELGMQWNDAKYNQYYFGVTKDESMRSGIEPYRVKQSHQPYASLAVNHRLNKHWSVFSVLSLNYLSSQQYHSPMIKSRTGVEPALGINYTF